MGDDSKQKVKSSAIEFTPEDVEANRKGKVTTRQIALAYSEPETDRPLSVRNNLWLIVVLWLLPLCAFASAPASNTLRSSAIQCLCMMAVMFPFAFFFWTGDKKQRQSSSSRQTSENVVLNVEGKPHLAKSKKHVTLRIHGLSFKINHETAAFFVNPGTYRVYYLSGTGRFLSAEYLADKLFKSSEA